MGNSQKPILAVTMGDPAGIGPEICVKALTDRKIYDICRPIIIGDKKILAHAADFCGIGLSYNVIRDPKDAKFEWGRADVFDLDNLPMEKHVQGNVTPEQGRASFEYVKTAIELALDHKVHGTVTGPINKAAMHSAGINYAGHTEIYADLTKTTDYAMMLTDAGFRVVHVSTHVSLREAINRVKKERILTVTRLTHDALCRIGIKEPKIAVAGLNPHCGEGGMFGTEDDEEIVPAVKAALDAGMNVEGPIPADTVFSKMKGGMYDAVVVQYHDQGHIPAKLMGFSYDDKTGTWGHMAGVNVTLGLPIIRTSVDHGTAFDRAGKGTANPQSMTEAIRLAALLRFSA